MESEWKTMKSAYQEEGSEIGEQSDQDNKQSSIIV